jgi:acyl-CoA reductase-like NAD-dependent aldehyde dehydrogenase
MSTTAALPDQLSEASRAFASRDFGTAADGRTFETLDPATGQAIASLPLGGQAEVDAAVAAARAAFAEGSAWRKLSPLDRGRLIAKLADAIEANADELAELESLDNGKPLKFARYVDVASTIGHLHYYAGWCTKIEGGTLPVSIPQMFAYTRREPVGVCGQIIPWNFPLLMAAWKLAPALAAGNTVVLKPAEQTPVGAMELASLIQEAGFPDGVVNVVPGYGETAGAALAAHPGIDKVAFTGSTEVGKLVAKAASDNLTKVSLELGGKAPNIVFADADIEQAVNGAMMGILFNQGQFCCAGSRLFLDARV